MPIEWGSDPVMSSTSLVVSTQAPSRTSLRTLVIDRNSVNQQLWVHMLQRLGSRPLAVADGREALAVLGQMPFDVILMDFDVPSTEGDNLAREIRTRSGQDDRPWLIAASHVADSAVYDRAMAAGMNDFMIKSGHFENMARAMRFAERTLQAPVVRGLHAA